MGSPLPRKPSKPSRLSCEGLRLNIFFHLHSRTYYSLSSCVWLTGTTLKLLSEAICPKANWKLIVTYSNCAVHYVCRQMHAVSEPSVGFLWHCVDGDAVMALFVQNGNRSHYSYEILEHNCWQRLMTVASSRLTTTSTVLLLRTNVPPFHYILRPVRCLRSEHFDQQKPLDQRNMFPLSSTFCYFLAIHRSDGRHVSQSLNSVLVDLQMFRIAVSKSNEGKCCCKGFERNKRRVIVIAPIL